MSQESGGFRVRQQSLKAAVSPTIPINHPVRKLLHQDACPGIRMVAAQFARPRSAAYPRAVRPRSGRDAAARGPLYADSTQQCGQQGLVEQVQPLGATGPPPRQQAPDQARRQRTHPAPQPGRPPHHPGPTGCKSANRCGATHKFVGWAPTGLHLSSESALGSETTTHARLCARQLDGEYDVPTRGR